MAAEIVADHAIPAGVSLDINPSSREVLMQLLASGHLERLVAAGARIHQAGCNGCIGMGQAPASGRNSLRTVPRNFPGRSGTKEDRVFLCSPETAAASALRGEITDPRALGRDPVPLDEPDRVEGRGPRAPKEGGEQAELIKGPNIVSIPELESLPGSLELEILLSLGDDVSTDEILPAGSRVLPYRSNLPAIAEFCFEPLAEDYAERARENDAHAVFAGENYGQGSSREHAALAPRYLGLRVVIARSFARIHRSNLINYGVLPLRWTEDRDLEPGATLRLEGLDRLAHGAEVEVTVDGEEHRLPHDLSEREVAYVRAGGRIAYHRGRG